MTNLINADALLAQMKEYYEKRAEEANMTGDRAICVTWHDAVILIKSAPTVDAIPIDFIKSEIKNNKGFYNNSLRILLDAWEEREEE